MPESSFHLFKSALGLLFCLTVANCIIERIIKLPFLNYQTKNHQMFTSPASIIFFASGIIWFYGFIQGCRSNRFNNKNPPKESFEEQQLIDQYFDQLIIDQNQLSTTKSFLSNKISQNELKSKIQAKLDSPLQLRQDCSQKPKFCCHSISQSSIKFACQYLELICFIYGIQNISFTTVLLFKIFQRLCLVTLFQTLFTQTQNKIIKFLTSLAAFGGLSLFIYSSVKEVNFNQNNKNLIYGYIFSISMCIFGLIKNLLQKQVIQNKEFLDLIIEKSKIFCILTYLQLIILGQEIYGIVFAIFHGQFFLQILMISLLITVGLFFKIILFRNKGKKILKFITIFQKIISLVVIMIIFEEGTNLKQIFSTIILIITGYCSYLIQINDKNSINNSQTKPSHKNYRPQGEANDLDEKNFLTS